MEEVEEGQKEERARGGEKRPQVQDPVHLYGLRPEFGLVRGGRGATGASGQKLISEKEPGEE